MGAVIIKGNKLGKGRPKGSVNNADIKAKIKTFLEDIAVEDIPVFYKLLKPSEKARFIPALMEFVIAKQRETKLEFTPLEISENESIVYKIPEAFQTPVKCLN